MLTPTNVKLNYMTHLIKNNFPRKPLGTNHVQQNCTFKLSFPNAYIKRRELLWISLECQRSGILLIEAFGKDNP